VKHNFPFKFAIALLAQLLVTAVVEAGTIQLPAAPAALVAFSREQKVYVATSDGVVSVIDPSTNLIAGVPLSVLPQPTLLAIDPLWGTLYSNSATQPDIAEVDAHTANLGDPKINSFWGIIPAAGSGPVAVAMDQQDQKLYIALKGENAVRVLDSLVSWGARYDLKSSPISIAIAYTPGRESIKYVATDDGQIYKIDGDLLLGPFPVGKHASSVIVSSSPYIAAQNRIYVATDTGVAVVGAVSLNVITTIPLSGNLTALAMNPLTGSLFVTDTMNNVTYVIDTVTNSVVATVAVGRGAVAVDVITSTSGDTAGRSFAYVANQQDGTISYFPDPAEATDLIRLPVRWCAIEGSSVADNVTVPDGKTFVSGTAITDSKLIPLLQQASTFVWLNGAHILFQAADIDHIPIVADPARPASPADGNLGDVSLDNKYNELEQVFRTCEGAWAAAAPLQRGIIAVNINAYQDNFSTLGLTDALSDLVGKGIRSKDLCTVPRKLTMSDLAVADVSVVDQGSKYYRNGERPDSTLAHELGHSLYLGHGDGVDNNRDGLQPPAPGNRWYDEYCDPLGLDPDLGATPKEDEIPGTLQGCGSVMLGGTAGCPLLQPLQVETARDAAKLVQGAVFPDASDPSGVLFALPDCLGPRCAKPDDLFLRKVEFLQDSSKHVTQVDLSLAAPTGRGQGASYYVYLDLDANERSGCDGRQVGLESQFTGAELVATMTVDNRSNHSKIETRLLRCVDGTFRDDSGGGASATLSGVTTSDNATMAGAHLTLTLLGETQQRTAGAVRLQVASARLGSRAAAHRLPAELDGKERLLVIPESLHTCRLTPSLALSGQLVALDADGLLPQHQARVYVSGSETAYVTSDASGHVHATIVAPAAAGLLVEASVVMTGTAHTATCALAVTGAERPQHLSGSMLNLIARFRVTSHKVKSGSILTYQIVKPTATNSHHENGWIEVVFDPKVLRLDRASSRVDHNSDGHLRWQPKVSDHTYATPGAEESILTANFAVLRCPRAGWISIVARDTAPPDQRRDVSASINYSKVTRAECQ
jgi:YVTN family beta-propeller protein